MSRYRIALIGNEDLGVEKIYLLGSEGLVFNYSDMKICNHYTSSDMQIYKIALKELELYTNDINSQNFSFYKDIITHLKTIIKDLTDFEQNTPILDKKRKEEERQSKSIELVILESPYALNNEIEKNVNYARECMKDCLQRGEAPFASHLLYTQEGVLNDTIPQERSLGIEAFLPHAKPASKTVVYIDLGISEGMKQGMSRAIEEGRDIEFRKIKG